MASLGSPGEWQGVVSAKIARVLVDVLEEVDCTGEVFTRRLQVIGGQTPALVVVLDAAARAQLLDELLAQLGSRTAGTNVASLRTFAELLQDSLVTDRSHRFDN